MEIGTTCLMALVGAFVSSPQFSAICEEWDIQAMAGMPQAMISLVPARVSLAYQVRLTSRLREVLRVRGPQEVHLQTILYPSSGPPVRRCFTIMSRILCPLPSVCCPLSVVLCPLSQAVRVPLELSALPALWPLMPLMPLMPLRSLSPWMRCRLALANPTPMRLCNLLRNKISTCPKTQG